MSDRREELHQILLDLFDGLVYVYYQPPENTKIKYPCIIYEVDYPHVLRANNKVHKIETRYTVTAISKDPDNDMAIRILTRFAKSSAANRFVVDNLYHDPMTVYY